MKLPRRSFLHLAAGVAVVSAVPRIASAQAYPTRPVRIVVGFAAGGANDIFARIIAQWLSERLRQPFVIENRPGAGSNIATEAVVRATADGHTLLLVNTANAINATLYDGLSFDFLRDISPAAGIYRQPNVMVVHPSFPAKTVPEFISYAKANPGKIRMASAGVGTSQHLAGELLRMMAAIDVIHIPYRGGAPAITDVLGGQVESSFFTLPTAIEYIKAGKLRPLAVTTAARSDALPGIPTVSEFVVGYEASAVAGIGAPGKTPREIIALLNKEINAGLNDPQLRARFAGLGSTPLVLSPTDFGNLIADETEKWSKVVKAAGIKPE